MKCSLSVALTTETGDDKENVYVQLVSHLQLA